MAASVDRQLPSLIESAERCERHLNRLNKYAIDSKSKHTHSTKKRDLLDEIISRVNGNTRALKAWIAAIRKGRQTGDSTIIATFTAVFETIISRIAEARETLEHRLTLSILHFHRSRNEEEDNRHIFDALQEIENIIGHLHNNVTTVLRDSPDQERRQKQINEVVLGRPRSYHVFVKVLSQMSEEARRTLRFGTLDLLWQEFPAKLDLEGHVGNADKPGDGKVYREQDVAKAAAILKAFYEAWQEAIIKANSANATSPETLRRVARITDTAKICLILRGMKQERLLDYFCEYLKDDKHLPLERTTVESILEPEDAPHAATFVAEQYRAVCRTWDDGGHIEIAEEEPLPLEVIDEYGTGSYGTVTRNRHAFTGAYYARKEQISIEAGKHLLREISRLKRLKHRHIVQFVKSYQRGNKYGILLKPAATTDLQKLLRRYARNGFDYDKDSRDRRRDRVTLKPVLLTAFGCLSRGLAHIHGCNIRHKDIKPSNILYEKALPPNPARFLWADFGLAYDFDHHPANSKTRSSSRYSPRYAAPEIMEEVQARKLRGQSEPNDEDEDDDIEGYDQEQPGSGQGRGIGHGRSSDIYSFGIVFLEILSHLIAEGTKTTIPGDFEACMPFWKNINDVQKWAQQQSQRLAQNDPLRFLFELGSKMIAYNAESRPSIRHIVDALTKASPEYFCTTCQQKPEDPVPGLNSIMEHAEGLQATEAENGDRVNNDGHGSIHEQPDQDGHDSIAEFRPRGSEYRNGKEPVVTKTAMRSQSRPRDTERRTSRARFE